MAKDKILITGGCGFIGSHIVDFFIKKGHEVAVIDSLIRGNKKNLNSHAKLYQIDISSSKIEKVFKKEKPRILIHLAAHINVCRSITNPQFDAHTNIDGSINLFKIAGESGIKKIIYSSSGGAIYGEPQYSPVDEKHQIAPLSPYGISKYTDELYLKFFAKFYNFDFVILRYANVYGPRQDPKGEAGVIPLFANKFLQKEQPLIFGNGKQTRDYIYVSDVAKSNYLAYKLGKNMEFNIGTGVSTSVLQICDSIRRFFKSKIKPKFVDAIPSEVSHIALDIKKAKSYLGFQPNVNLKKGLEKTLFWIKENI